MILMGLLPAASAMAASAPSVSLTGPSSVTQSAGSNVTYTAQASNVSNPVYQFWVEGPNGNWTDAQNWSSSNTFTLSNVQDGNYLVTAYVAPAGHPSMATNAQANGQQAVDGVFVDSTVSVNAPSTLVAGKSVTVTASSSNVFNAVYQFWYKDPSGNWHQSGNYGGSSFTFTPSQTGKYEFVAYAKSPLALNNPEGAMQSPNPAYTSVGAAVPSLSAVNVTGQTSGSGSSGSPATSTNGNAITVSTTLMDSSGNPIAGTGITYALSGSTTMPEVMSNGTTVPETSGGTNVYDYTVYTNSNGMATATVNVPTGASASYTVTATAPFQVNGTTLQASPVILEFASANTAIITPAIAQTVNVGTVVPVTITLPTNSSGNAQANVAVVFGTTTGYFTDASGTSDIGQSQTAFTNSSGQATVYVVDPNAGNTIVTATPPSAIANPQSTGTITWGQPGVVSGVGNLSVSGQTGTTTATNGYNAAIGSNVTVSGQLQDSQGNPVPNASMVVVGSGFSNGTNSYVSGSSTTAFPQVTTAGTVSSSTGDVTAEPLTTLSGTPTASSAYGDIVTTDANGNFSFTVTNGTASPPTGTASPTNGYDAYQLFPVVNGQIDTTGLLSYPLEVTWTQGTTLSSIGLSVGSGAPSSSATSLTGIDAPAGSPLTLNFEGFSGTAAFTAGSVNYTASLSAGSIQSVSVPTSSTPASTNVPNLSSVGIQVTPNSSGGTYTVIVNGNQLTAAATSPVVSLGVEDSSAQSSTLTVSGDGQKSTAALTFTASGQASANSSVTPSYDTVGVGQSQTFTLSVVDANGNPVANTSVPITYDLGSSATNHLWLTAVNGATLQTSSSVYGTEATPIPLYAKTYAAPSTSSTASTSVLGYNSVTIPSVVSWSNPSSSATTGKIYVETNSSGNVTLTLTAGGTAASYFNSTGSNGAASESTQPTTTPAYFGYNSTNGLTFGTASTGSFGQVNFYN